MYSKIIMFQIQYTRARTVDWKAFEKKTLDPMPESKSETNPETNPETTPYYPYLFETIQNYNPIYNRFFTMNENNYNHIGFKTYKEFFDPSSVVCHQKKSKNTSHIKFAPLLDPIHYLIGKYDKSKEELTQLPQFQSANCFPKVADENNAAYVDGFFNFLCSQMLNHHQFPNAIDFYGSFLAIQKEFKFDGTDDLSYLQESEYFKNKRNILYRLVMADEDEYMTQNLKNTHRNRPKISIADSRVDLDVDVELEVECHSSSTVSDPMEMVFQSKDSAKKDGTVETTGDLDHVHDNDEVDDDDDDDDSDSSSLCNTSDEDECDEDQDDDDDESKSDSDNKSDDASDSERESERGSDEDSEEDEDQVDIYIKNFPVQLICMEKCDGTLDELLENEEIDENEIESALTQMVFSLLVYQKCFSFTHNDLHTNNIAYVKTDIQYIVYTYEKQKYYVPTYGRMFKMIDFGRAIFKYQDKVFCSDSFAIGGDAHSQYNFPPFFDANKPQIDPNMSFDLCRLGCSLFDFVFDEEEDTTDTKTMNRLQKTVLRWCTDDNGKNILYMKNGEERYPNFKLYKMIARIVHKNTPQEEVNHAMIKRYQKIPKGKQRICEFSMDDMPVYFV